MSKSKHDKYFELAKRISTKSDHPKHHIGCVLVKKNKIISTGWNLMKTHPLSPRKFKSVHSEFYTILGVPVSDLKGAIMYLYRENRQGEYALAKPCKYCDRMLEDCGIKAVYYTTNGGIDCYEYY